jgi:hypothetical protein
MHKAELYNVYPLPNNGLIRVIKSIKMRWEEHAAGMREMRNANRILVRRHEWKRPLG